MPIKSPEEFERILENYVSDKEVIFEDLRKNLMRLEDKLQNNRGNPEIVTGLRSQIKEELDKLQNLVGYNSSLIKEYSFSPKSILDPSPNSMKEMEQRFSLLAVNELLKQYVDQKMAKDPNDKHILIAERVMSPIASFEFSNVRNEACSAKSPANFSGHFIPSTSSTPSTPSSLNSSSSSISSNYNPEKVIESVQRRLDSAMLVDSRNTTGNFANMCRAIQTTFSGIEGWGFDKEIVDKLGMDTPSSSAKL